jgi:hypothetical protein
MRDNILESLINAAAGITFRNERGDHGTGYMKAIKSVR